MPVKVIQYDESWRRFWEKTIWKANNGTLFHTRKFLGYHPPDRFEDHSLIFQDGENVIALLPAALRMVEGKKVLSSHCGASYGGFVTMENLSVRQAFDLVESLIDFSVKKDFQRIEMTLPPIIYLSRPSHYLDFALYKCGFSYKKREVSSVIPLDFASNEILMHFKPEARTAYRKSLKLKVKIRESDDFDTFYPILEKNLAMRHHVKPTHSLEELKLLKHLFPEHIRHFGAYLGSKMIAGVTNFISNDRVVLAFYISHDEEYQKYRPVNHLFYEIISWCIQNHFRFLDYGIFTVNEDPNWGLGKFKESFGARGILRETYKIDI